MHQFQSPRRNVKRCENHREVTKKVRETPLRVKIVEQITRIYIII